MISGASIILSANSIIPNITQRDYVLSFLIFGIVSAEEIFSTKPMTLWVIWTGRNRNENNTGRRSYIVL